MDKDPSCLVWTKMRAIQYGQKCWLFTMDKDASCLVKTKMRAIQYGQKCVLLVQYGPRCRLLIIFRMEKDVGYYGQRCEMFTMGKDVTY